MPSPLALFLLLAAIGAVLMLADVEERLGWLLVVIGVVGAFIVALIGASSDRRGL